MINFENESLKVSVNPLGAELSNVTRKSDGTEYIWQGDPTVWSGRAPVLFPICGRLAKDTYYLNGEQYILPKHGFARRKPFTLAELRDGGATFVLTADEKTKISYPFDFKLTVDFSLDGNALKTVYTVENEDEKTMYFSLGALPAFNVGIGGSVVMPKEEKITTLTVNSEGLIDGEKLVSERSDRIELTPTVFENDALIFASPSYDHVDVVSPEGKKLVRMSFGKTPYLLLWAKPGAPYVCVEPWHGLPDGAGEPNELSEKEGIITLKAGEKFVFKTKCEFFKQK